MGSADSLCLKSLSGGTVSGSEVCPPPTWKREFCPPAYKGKKKPVSHLGGFFLQLIIAQVEKKYISYKTEFVGKLKGITRENGTERVIKQEAREKQFTMKTDGSCRKDKDTLEREMLSGKSGTIRN